MRALKNQDDIYLFELENGYEIQNQRPKYGTQYSRMAKTLDEAELIYQDETGNNQLDIKQLTCLRCGHTWWPNRPERPTRCPKCKTPYWDKPRKQTRDLPE